MLEYGIALQEAMTKHKNESYDEEWVECDWCHELTPEDELITLTNGQKICEYCLEEARSHGERVEVVYGSLNESALDARPNHSKLLDLLYDDVIDYKFVAKNLMSWLPDDELGDFIEMYDLDVYNDFEEPEE